jgi:hypothetical protein
MLCSLSLSLTHTHTLLSLLIIAPTPSDIMGCVSSNHGEAEIEKIFQALCATPFFLHLKEDHLRLFSALFETHTFPPNSVIVHQGSIVDKLFVVHSGVVCWCVGVLVCCVLYVVCCVLKRETNFVSCEGTVKLTVQDYERNHRRSFSLILVSEISSLS